MLIRDIRQLIVVPPGPLSGDRQRAVTAIDNAAIHIDSGKIRWFGRAADAPGGGTGPVLSAGGGCVVPGLIDCHTHIPFAGERSGEFVRRVAGESYLSIMQSGGGIRVTTAAVRAASEEDLAAENLARLARMLALGVTTAECKSGYGLNVADEFKQLRVTQRLAQIQPIELIPTYLGAHAVPAEFQGRADAFLDEIGSLEVLSDVRRQGLARFCDVFCDRGAFDTVQARRLLERARAAGLELKLHADELAQIGASRLAGELGAISADHLEVIDEGGIAALRAAGTVAVVLPGCSFFLGIEHSPARKLIAAGVPVAVATDLNPGSSHVESLPLVMNIACCQMRMTPEEVLVGCTANAAAAIGESQRLGAIAVGHYADLLVLDTPSLAEWFYSPGRNRTRAVLKRGVQVA